MSEELPQIDRETQARFYADGVACVRGVLPPSSVTALAQAMDDIASKRGPDDIDWAYRAAHSDLYEMAEAAPFRTAAATAAKERPSLTAGNSEPVGYIPPVWRRNIVVRVIGLDSALPQIAAAILDAAKVNFCGDHVAIQEPRTEAAAHFARDENLLPVANGSGCSMWICLDNVPESESQAFLRGSHRRSERNGSKPSRAKDDTVLRFATAPGDLIVYDLRTYRAPGGNSSSQRRRGLALHYCDETMCFRRQPGISPRALYPGLKDGGPLDSPDFPVVWPRPYPAFAIATLYENAAPALDSARRGRK